MRVISCAIRLIDERSHPHVRRPSTCLYRRVFLPAHAGKEVQRGATRARTHAAGAPTPTTPNGPPGPARFVALLARSFGSTGANPPMACASADAFGVAFNAYANLALIPAFPPRLAMSLARGHQPRANAETSTVSQSVLLQHIDAAMLWTPQSPGASPGFHPPEGGKAVRLRVPVIFRRFAGFPALAPGLSRGLFVFRPIAP